MVSPPVSGDRRLAILAAYLVCASIVLAPFASVGIPGLGDTLNHLARMHILSTIGRSPDLQRYYGVHWTPIPYLAMDAVVPPLLRLMPIYLAGKLFAMACVVLPVAGVAAVHYAVHRRASLVPCAAFLVSTNALLSLGFLNFLFSAGCALLLFAVWIACAGWARGRRAALFAPLVLVLYFGHAFACAAYCAAVGGFELGRAARAGFRPARTVALDLAACFAQAVPALYFGATLDVASGYLGTLQTHYGSLGDKLAALLSPFLFLHDNVQGLVAAGTVVLAALLARRVRVSATIWPAVAVLAAAAAAMPHVLASTWGTDLRFPLVVVLLLIAGARVAAGPVVRAAAFSGFLGLLAAKSADSWAAMHRVDAAFDETRRLLSGLPRGARLLVVNPAGQGTGREAVPVSTIWHMPMVALIDRDAFLPTLFSGLTSVRVKPAYRLSSTPNGRPISPAQLWEGFLKAEDGVERGDGQGARLYHFGWPQKFDFVLVQRFGGEAGSLPDNLVPVGHGEDEDLYRVAVP